MKSQVLRAGAGGLMFLCFACALLYGCPKGREKNIRILTGKVTYTAEEAIAYQRQAFTQGTGISAFTIWAEEKNVMVQNPDLNRQDTANLVTVCGDSSLVLLGSVSLDGAAEGGCLLDEELCLRLLGSTRTEGAVLQVGAERYPVRGLLYGTKDTILIEAGGKENTVLDRVSVEIPKDSSPDDAVRKLSNQVKLPEHIINLKVYEIIGGIAARLLPAFLFLKVLCSIGKWGIKEERHTKNRFAAGLLFLLLLAVFLWITGIKPSIPKEWVPTRWSDFEFFEDLWKQKSEEAMLLLTGEKSQTELLYLMKCIKALGFGVAAAAFSAAAFGKRKITGAAAYGWSICFVCLAFFMTTVPKGYEGLTLAGNRMLWLTLPIWLWGKLLWTRTAEKLRQ